MFGNRIVTRDCVIHCSYCPSAAISPARRLPRVTDLTTTTVEEEGASTLALRQVRSRIGLSSPYVVPAIDKQTASGPDHSDCSPLESPGYLTPANPGRQGTISTESDRFSHGNGRSDDSKEHQRRQCVQTGRQIRLIVRMIRLRIISSIMPPGMAIRSPSPRAALRKNP